MSLHGTRVAILVEDLYQDHEVWYPYYRLKEAGADVVIVGTGKPEYKSKHGYPIRPDVSAEQLSAKDVDGVIVPGGYAPDLLRRHPSVIRLVKEAHAQGKVLGVICHGGWVLCSADVLRGKTMTGFVAIRDDLVNAGATFVDQAVVRDGQLVTSRTPDDLPDFLRTLIEALHGSPSPTGAAQRQAERPSKSAVRERPTLSSSRRGRTPSSLSTRR